MGRNEVADLTQNSEIAAGWSGLFVLHFLLSRRITENWPAYFSFSCGMPVRFFFAYHGVYGVLWFSYLSLRPIQARAIWFDEINEKATSASMNKVISLFSGGMGLDLGFEAAGFKVALAADNMPAAVKTIRHNRPELPIFDGDIREVSGRSLLRLAKLRKSDLDLVIGGPPCQSFSTAGKRLSVDDSNNGPLVFDYIRLINEMRPKAFLMENVAGILSASLTSRKLPYNNNGKRIDNNYGTVLDSILERFRSIGYSVSYRLLNSADFGVPQRRLRVFFIGFRGESELSFPEPTHCKNGDLLLRKWRTLGEVIKGIKHDTSHVNKFSERKLKYLRMVPPGGNWRNLPNDVQLESMGRAYYAKGGRCGYWRRLSFDQTSPTILTEPQNASTSLCHPAEDRPLSVRECARIQTFPDEWEFIGRGSEQYKLVGNGVPVELAKVVAESLRSQLLKRLSDQKLAA